jgi:plastocyanin
MQLGTQPISRFAALAAVAFTATCGGGSSNNVGPTPTGSGNTTPTITIANNAVSPRSIIVARGSRVLFVNNDNQSHDMASDPHPVHTDCPEINQVGFLNPGQSRQTSPLNTTRACGFHDHNRESVTSLQGTITIQ